MEFGSLLIPLGLVPSMFILYFMVGRYEGKFREKNILLAFVIGFILGLFIYLIEMGNIPVGKKIYLFDIFIIAAAFSFLEQTAKLMVLNARFLKDDALPLYGVAIGAGYASTFAPIFIRSIEVSLYGLAIAIIPVLVLLLTCYSAVLIAIGIKKDKKAIQFFYAYIFSFIVWVLLLLLFNFKYQPLQFSLLFIAIFALTAFAVYHAYYKLLPFSMLRRQELKKIL